MPMSQVESFILDQEELESGPTIEIANKLLRLDSQGHPDLRAVDPDTLEAFLDAAGEFLPKATSHSFQGSPKSRACCIKRSASNCSQ